MVPPGELTLDGLDGVIAALPAGVTRCAPRTTLFVGFAQGGAWTHRIYDRNALPEAVLALFDALRLRRPPRDVPRLWPRRRLEPGHADDLAAMALSPGGLLATCARDGGLVRDLASGRVREQLYGEGLPVQAVAFAGEEVAWCTRARLRLGARSIGPEGEPGTVVGGDPAGRGPVMVMYEADPSLAVSPDGRLLAVSHFDARTDVTVLALPDLARCARLAGHAEPVIALAFSPDSQTLATGDFSREVRLWSAATGGAPQVMLERRVLPGGVAALAFSPDGARLAGAASEALQIWDIATGERIELRANIDRHLERGRAVAWSPDGRLLAEARESGVVIWDTAGWRERGIVEVEDRPVGVAFASAEELVVGCEERIGVWDLAELAAEG